MGSKKGASFFTRSFDMFRKIFLFFVKVIYIAPLFVFGLWLISVVYFPGFDLNASISLLKYKKEQAALKIISRKKEAIPRDHFHMVDEYVEKRDIIEPTCVICHGAYAHGKEKKVRALLNLHDSAMACSVCHVRADQPNGGEAVIAQSGKVEFLWVDQNTGKFSQAVDGGYGKYPAKIFPVIDNGQGIRQILTPITEEVARAFLERAKGLNEKQLEEERKQLHAGISKEPVACSDCHKKDGYLDLQKLGFPRQRIDNLISSEFVGMIDKYKTFYLPSVIDFRGGK